MAKGHIWKVGQFHMAKNTHLKSFSFQIINTHTHTPLLETRDRETHKQFCFKIPSGNDKGRNTQPWKF